MQQFLQQVFVGEVGFFGRVGKIFAGGDLRIGIRFEHVDVTVFVHPHIDASVTTQPQCTIDALGQVLNMVDDSVREVPRLARADAVLVLVLAAPLHPLRRDAAGLIRHLVHHEFPDRKHLQVRIAHHPDIELASFDVPLDEGSSADIVVDKCHPFPQLLIVVDNRGLRNPQRCLFADRLHDQWEGQVFGSPHHAMQGHDHEFRVWNTMVRHHLLRQRLVARKHEAAWIAAGVGNAHQFEIGHHVLVVDRPPVELLQ